MTTSATQYSAHQILIEALASASGLPPEQVASQLNSPPKADMGDYAFPCFAYGKQHKIAPPAAAGELAGKLAQNAAFTNIASAEAAGPFLNIRLKPGVLAQSVLQAIAAAKGTFGDSNVGAGKTIVVDYSGPNIAKPFHVGHLMSTILGASLIRIYRALGYKAVGVNHLGDWGVQCGFQFLAWECEDPIEREKQLSERGLDYLADLYVNINRPAYRLTLVTCFKGSVQTKQRDPSYVIPERMPADAEGFVALLEGYAPRFPDNRFKELVRFLRENIGKVLTVDFVDQFENAACEAVTIIDRQARSLFKRLEDGDPVLKQLWEKLRKETLSNLQKSYDRLRVKFESDAGEGFYESMLKPLLNDLQTRGIAVMSEGALVIPMDDKPAKDGKSAKPPFILLKEDAATIYGTRDLAAALYRKKEYDFAKNIYVVDVRQSLHFQQLFKAVEKMGHAWSKDCVHVSFGLMRTKEGDTMTTRGGRMVPLNELLDKMVDVVRKIVVENNPELPGDKASAVAEAVGVGAIVFWIQSRRRTSDFVFDWTQATDPRGDTGPYLQYTHARTRSILRKAQTPREQYAAANLALLVEPEEAAVAKALEQFPKAIRQAAQDYEPSLVSSYLLELASVFGNFLNKHRVLDSQPGLREARLMLVDTVSQVLAKGLTLLGMVAPEEM